MKNDFHLDFLMSRFLLNFNDDLVMDPLKIWLDATGWSQSDLITGYLFQLTQKLPLKLLQNVNRQLQLFKSQMNDRFCWNLN